MKQHLVGGYRNATACTVAALSGGRREKLPRDGELSLRLGFLVN